MRGACCAIAALLLAAGPVSAASNANAVKGIVKEHCIACHEVPGYEARHGKADVPAPSFLAMAQQPETYTAARMRKFLRRPHDPMRKFTLSPADIENLIAFVQALR